MLQQGGVYLSAYPLEVIRLFASFFAEPLDPLDLLRLVGPEDAARTQVRRLSGGQRQRLSLALALIGRPELLFLDEPTTAMDPQARLATWELIRSLKQQGVTILLTTHFMDEAERLADRVAILDQGRLMALDSPPALIQRRAGGAGFAPGSDTTTSIRFRTRPGLEVVELSRCLGGVDVREESPGSYAAQMTPGPAQVANLATWLADQDALLSDLHVGGTARSLEDVFLELTGREWRD